MFSLHANQIFQNIKQRKFSFFILFPASCWVLFWLKKKRSIFWDTNCLQGTQIQIQYKLKKQIWFELNCKYKNKQLHTEQLLPTEKMQVLHLVCCLLVGGWSSLHLYSYLLTKVHKSNKSQYYKTNTKLNANNNATTNTNTKASANTNSKRAKKGLKLWSRCTGCTIWLIDLSISTKFKLMLLVQFATRYFRAMLTRGYLQRNIENKLINIENKLINIESNC